VLIIPVRWRTKTAYILRSAVATPTSAARVDARIQPEDDRPFFYESSGERFGFGPREFQIEMLARLERGERLW